MMHKYYKTKNIIITGASQGIGAAMAQELAAMGANLLLMARNQKNLARICEELSQKYPEADFYYYAGDITNANTILKATELAEEKFSQLHGLINNAGFARPGYFEKLPADDFEQTMQLNYLAAVHMTRSMLPLMQQDSFISYTSSVVGYLGVFGFTSYAPSKFALIGFAQSLRQELWFRKIHISVLCPPDTDTPGLKEEDHGKPIETLELSKSAKLMDANVVAKRFLKKLSRKKFMININFESSLFYILQRLMPETVFHIMIHMLKKARKTISSQTQQE